MNILVSTKDMDYKEWLEARKKGIGGSDVAAIAGQSKYKSPLDVYLEKIGEVQNEVDSESAYWGTVLEDVVAREFEIRTGKKVRRKNAILTNPEYPFMLANVDRMVIGEKAGLECKTASEYMKDEWEGEDIPNAYMLQIQHYMAVTGFDTWYVAVLIGGNKFKHYKIARDEEIIKHLYKIESEFWFRVENRIPPEETDVNKRFPQSVPDTSMVLPDEAEELIAQYLEAQHEEKQWADRKELIANQIKELLGTNEVGLTSKHQVTWKTISSSRFDTTAFKKVHPDLYKEFAKESEYRKFQVKEVK